MSEYRVFVPRFVDDENVNAQNLNAKGMLSRFRDPRVHWTTLHHHRPSPQITSSPTVHSVPLWKARLWQPHLTLQYQRPADAIFYVGPGWMDGAGLALRRWCGRSTRTIATLEGFVGDSEREAFLGSLAGHPVHCQRIAPRTVRRIDDQFRRADQIFAISPFLRELGEHLYGNKITFLPLGLDTDIFNTGGRAEPARPRIITAATVKSVKEPEAFLGLAEAFSQCDFVWFGGGKDLQEYRKIAESRHLANVEFAGPRTPPQLSMEFQRSTLFVMVSKAEGAPKVIQEAAACGLPLVVYGFYESPFAVDGENGIVVWNAEAFVNAVRRLLSDTGLRESMGAKGALMAKNWSWDCVAPLWEREIIAVLNCGRDT